MKKVYRLAGGSLAGVLLAAVVTVAAAQEQKWAKDMFDRASWDFGTVARGAKVEHHFKIENVYVEDVHIQSVRSTCGCTQPQATKSTLKTWETAEVVATLDTRKFLGRKDATITVVFDRPFGPRSSCRSTPTFAATWWCSREWSISASCRRVKAASSIPKSAMPAAAIGSCCEWRAATPISRPRLLKHRGRAGESTTIWR